MRDDPANLPAGSYPSTVTQISASAPVLGLFALGVGGETRALADFGTGTVHRFTTFSVVLGFDWGASLQTAGGPGDRNSTDLRADGGALTGLSVGAAGDLIIVGGAGFSSNLYPWSTYSATTRSIGVGLDVGVSLTPSWTVYETALPLSALPQDLQQFYNDAWNRYCGGGK